MMRTLKAVIAGLLFSSCGIASAADFEAVAMVYMKYNFGHGKHRNKHDSQPAMGFGLSLKTETLNPHAQTVTSSVSLFGMQTQDGLETWSMGKLPFGARNH